MTRYLPLNVVFEIYDYLNIPHNMFLSVSPVFSHHSLSTNYNKYNIDPSLRIKIDNENAVKADMTKTNTNVSVSSSHQLSLSFLLKNKKLLSRYVEQDWSFQYRDLYYTSDGKRKAGMMSNNCKNMKPGDNERKQVLKKHNKQTTIEINSNALIIGIKSLWSFA